LRSLAHGGQRHGHFAIKFGAVHGKISGSKGAQE
jgi:hypothetical protein